MNFLRTEVFWAAQHRWAAREHFGSMPQPFETLWLVCDGAVCVEIAGEKFEARAGDVFLMPAQRDRDIFSPDGAKWWSLGWQMRALDGSNPLEKLPLPLLFSPTETVFGALCEGAQFLAREWGGGENVVINSRDLAAGKIAFWPAQPHGNAALVWNGLENFLAGWFWRGAENAGFAAPSPRVLPVWLQKTLRDMNANPARSVVDFADDAAFSPSRFRALFAQEIGVSPHEFLSGIRLERARQRLENSADSIEKIALDVGFDSSSHFARRFAAHFGQTPQKYRISNRQNHKIPV